MKVGGQIPWNVTPICETSQIYYLVGRRPMKDVLGNRSKDRLLFRLVHWLSITLQLRRTSQESINLERTSYMDVLRICKHYTSKYRIIVREILHENNGYGEKLLEQVCDELQHHK